MLVREKKAFLKFFRIAIALGVVSGVGGTVGAIVGGHTTPVPKELRAYRNEVKKLVILIRKEGLAASGSTPASHIRQRKAGKRISIKGKGLKSMYRQWLDDALKENPDLLSAAVREKVNLLNKQFDKDIKPRVEKYKKHMDKRTSKGLKRGAAVGLGLGVFGLTAAGFKRKDYVRRRK